MQWCLLAFLVLQDLFSMYLGVCSAGFSVIHVRISLHRIELQKCCRSDIYINKIVALQLQLVALQLDLKDLISSFRAHGVLGFHGIMHGILTNG